MKRWFWPALVVVLCARAAATARDDAGDPISFPPESLNTRDVQPLWSKTIADSLGSAYDSVGKHNELWDEQARATVVVYADLLTIHPNYRDYQRLWHAFKPLRARDVNCNDPLIMFTAAWFWHRWWTYPKAAELYDWAVPRMRRSRYPNFIVGECIYWAGRLAQDQARDDDAESLLGEGFDRTLKGLLASELGEDKSRLWFWLLRAKIQRCPISNVRRLSEGLDEAPIEPWLRSMLRGELHFRFAYDARGSGFKIKDPETAMRELVSARRHFREAASLAPDRPEAAERLIAVVRTAGSGWESPRHWFDKAVSAQCDWTDAYLEYIYALAPRWSRSGEPIPAFAKACYATGRYDTTIPSHGVDAMIKLTEDLEDSSEVFADRKFYAEAKRVIERTVAEGQTAHATKWLRTLQLGLARHAGEQEDEAALRKELGQKMSPQALRKLGLGFADFKD